MVYEVSKALNSDALHFAFLDPYNLGSLDFQIFVELSQYKRMDILAHVSALDLQRNFGKYLKEPDKACPIDQFLPNWRNLFDVNATGVTADRNCLLNAWKNRLEELDLDMAETAELVTGSKKQPLYWLMFAAKHDRAHEFWEKVRDLKGQTRQMF